ncbi:major histocompatibility complex class I-related protein 1-like isoform X1 [Mixophyes fleayi]|uniref:major histocompatibility complex class I-related protein 1-like isoform X1 n=1 Tax=Mixophyes fleayi TaxID=3061075 RepID=UPI003F4D8537
MMYPLFLLILGVSGVYSDSHSLHLYATGVSGRGWGLPEFSAVGFVEDQQIGRYTSDSRLARPVAPWMIQLEPDFSDEQTLRFNFYEADFKLDVSEMMSNFDQTEGFHSYQWAFGCDLRDDGSTTAYERFGYDGRDLLYLDIQRAVYVASMPEVQHTVDRWNSPEVREGERTKIELENDCIEFLKEFINYGKDDLEKRVPPEVKVTGQKSDGVTKLHCWVYGFHPRAVDIRWIKNEKYEIPLDEAQPILPNPDGTYQTRVNVEVAAGEEDSYSCHVDHSSLEKTLSVKWEPKSGLTIGVIIGAVFGCLVVLGIAGSLIYKRCSGGSRHGRTLLANSVECPLPETPKITNQASSSPENTSDYETDNNPEATKRRSSEIFHCHRQCRFPALHLLTFCFLLLIHLMQADLVMGNILTILQFVNDLISSLTMNHVQIWVHNYL